ncbi:MAG: glycosyltransferase [Planctomycetes bacterium]|nr:glycosyltransferase [Planctomycetota bacterium]
MTEPLRLLHVLAETGYSGGEAQLRLLIEHFARLGWENAVVLAPGAKFAAVARELGVQVYEAPLRRWWRPDLWWKLRAAYRAARPDVIHFACGRSLLLGGLAARGVAAKKFTIRRIDYPIAKGLRGGFRYTALVDHTIAISKAIRKRLLGAGVAESRVTLVHDGIDPAPWTGLQQHKAAARQRLGVAADAQVIGCAGVLRPRKGQHVLIDAFARIAADHPKAVLFLAGDGSEKDKLRVQAARLGLAQRVFVPGRVQPTRPTCSRRATSSACRRSTRGYATRASRPASRRCRRWSATRVATTRSCSTARPARWCPRVTPRRSPGRCRST